MSDAVKTYNNQDDSIYNVPNNIALTKFIPRERKNEKYQVENIEYCRKCINNNNQYFPVFTYTTTLKLRNGKTQHNVLNSDFCTIHDVESSFPDDYSKQMFTNKTTQRRYETLIERRYFQSNRSSEFYKMLIQNSKNVNLKNKDYSSGISSLQTLYNEIFDIDQELFLLFEKKKFVERNQVNLLPKKSKVDLQHKNEPEPEPEPEMYVEMRPNDSYIAFNAFDKNENPLKSKSKPKDVQSVFKNLKMRNGGGFEYEGNLSTERIIYYRDGSLKAYNILRVSHVFEHVTLGGILGKNDFLEFSKYLEDEVFTKRHREIEFVRVKENKIEMGNQSIKAVKNINIIKYTMEDYPFMVSAIMNWLTHEDNCSKIIYPHW